MNPLWKAPLIALGFAVVFQLAAALGWSLGDTLASTAMVVLNLAVVAALLLDWHIGRARRAGLRSRWDVPAPEPAPVPAPGKTPDRPRRARPLFMNGLLCSGLGAWLLLRGFRPLYAAIAPLVSGVVFFAWALFEATRRPKDRSDGEPT